MATATETHSGTKASPEFQAFLDEHLEREMLRFTTAGSVDDGKSTLIGRLLHDTKACTKISWRRSSRAGSIAPPGQLIFRC